MDKKNLKISRNYMIAALLTALAGAVYEHFSFGVYSNYMIYAFVPLLLFGALPFLLAAIRNRAAGIPDISRKLWHFGTAVLTVGCLFAGVLEIYGTQSALMPVYWIAGSGMLAAAAITAFIRLRFL